jgi:hypothetical protein
MIKHIHVHQRVERTIEQMSILNNAPMIAALRARNIIQTLVDGIMPARTILMSGKKDARIKKRFKFDLGKGYRLITIREKESMYILFIGTHEQCDRWLDDNRKKKIHMRPIPLVSYTVKPVNNGTAAIYDSAQYSENNMEFTGDDFIHISQIELREVFCGLVTSH